MFEDVKIAINKMPKVRSQKVAKANSDKSEDNTNRCVRENNTEAMALQISDVSSLSEEIANLKIKSKGGYSECPKCNKNIKSTYIITHLKTYHAPVKMYTCPEDSCSWEFNRIDNLVRHLKMVHLSQNPHVCKYCSKRYPSASELHIHYISHKSRNNAERPKYVSNHLALGKVSKRHRYPKEHERQHERDRKLKCKVCDKQFSTDTHMKQHLYKHDGIKPHECRWKCGAIFASYSGRIRHERTNHHTKNSTKRSRNVGAQPYRNPKCFKSHTRAHLSHKEEKGHECHICGKKFKRKQNADSHLLNIHKFNKEDLNQEGQNAIKKHSDCPNYMTSYHSESTTSDSIAIQEIIIKEEVDLPDCVLKCEIENEDDSDDGLWKTVRWPPNNIIMQETIFKEEIDLADCILFYDTVIKEEVDLADHILRYN